MIGSKKEYRYKLLFKREIKLGNQQKIRNIKMTKNRKTKENRKRYIN